MPLCTTTIWPVQSRWDVRFLSGTAVSRPARVADSIVPSREILAMTSSRFRTYRERPNFHLPSSVTTRYTGGRSPRYQLAQTFDDYRHHFLGTDVADNSAT